MARNGRKADPTPAGNITMLLAQLVQGQQATNVLLETIARSALGQSARDIRWSIGVELPVASEEAIAQAMADQAAMEEAAALAAAEAEPDYDGREEPALD